MPTQLLWALSVRTGSVPLPSGIRTSVTNTSGEVSPAECRPVRISSWSSTRSTAVGMIVALSCVEDRLGLHGHDSSAARSSADVEVGVDTFGPFPHSEEPIVTVPWPCGATAVVLDLKACMTTVHAQRHPQVVGLRVLPYVRDRLLTDPK